VRNYFMRRSAVAAIGTASREMTDGRVSKDFSCSLVKMEYRQN